MKTNEHQSTSMNIDYYRLPSMGSVHTPDFIFLDALFVNFIIFYHYYYFLFYFTSYLFYYYVLLFLCIYYYTHIYVYISIYY